VAKIEAMLSERRLLTLTGPGGSGKTPLALRVASGAIGGCEDGAWLVELAPPSGLDLVARAVAQTLSVREEPGRPVAEALSRHLAATELLLVLNN
jgi:non-specific serine/threonine protein kinase